MKSLRIVGCALILAAAPALAASGDASVGKKKATTCAACHNSPAGEGISPSPEFPNLAGQYADYLETALKHYKSQPDKPAKRKNPIMAEQVKNLSDKDIMDLAAYYSSQRGLQIKY